MNRKISKVYIRDLFDSNDIFWELKDVNVLVGKNGTGKSTILQLIKSCVTSDCNYEAFDSCEGMQLVFDDEHNKKVNNTLFSPKTITESMKKVILESEFFKSELSTTDKNNKDLEDKLQTHLQKYFFQKESIEEYFLKQLDDNPVKLDVEYISTVNMIANSIFNRTKSDGSIVNFLDSEIDEELNKLLLSNDSKKNIKKLQEALNNMLSDTGKTVYFDEKKLKFILKNGKEIKLRQLSSGERQIIYIFIKVINANINNALILMDEPEISLHLSWQEKLLSQIRAVNKDSQIIIVTHSPAIVMNGWMDSFIDIKDIFVEKKSD